MNEFELDTHAAMCDGGDLKSVTVLLNVKDKSYTYIYIYNKSVCSIEAVRIWSTLRYLRNAEMHIKNIHWIPSTLSVDSILQ